jgi:peptide/nickel transport system permease protein/peptide/nickel transport system substrate-binding protein
VGALGALGAFGALILTATLPPCAALAGPSDNILVWGNPNEPATLDPASGIAGTEIPYLYTIYDRLVDFDPATLDPKPGLATSWKWSDDNRTLEMTLREGVTFHDGTPFNAEAAVKSLQHFKDAKKLKDLDPVVGMEAKAPNLLVLKVDRDFSVLPSILADRAGMIVSPTALEKYGAEFGRHPVGTGPFMFKSWQQGNSVEVEKYPQYWNAAAIKLSGIRWQLIRQSTSLITALQTGQVDYVQQVDPINLPLLERNKNVRTKVEPTTSWSVINLNTSMAPLDDARVRRAIAMSVDRKVLAAIGYGPNIKEAKPASLMEPDNYWPSTPSLQDTYTKYQPDEAKKLLAEAGHPDGITLNMCVDANSGSPEPGAKLSDAMREQMKAANITLNTTMVAGLGACIELFNFKKSIPAVLIAWTGRPDPFMTYQQIMASDGAYNTGKSNFGVDGLFPPMLKNPSREQLKASYDKLNKAFVEQLPMVPLYFMPVVSAYSTAVEGELPAMMSRPIVAYMSFKK